MHSLSILTRRLFFTLLLAGVVSTPTLANNSRQEKSRPAEEQRSLVSSNVAGVKVSVASNRLLGTGRLQSREICLLIDASDFTKENLEKVFVDLAAQYDWPLGLSISAFSDLEFARRVTLANYLIHNVEPTSASRTLQILAGVADEPEAGHFRASYQRTASAEMFWYTSDSASADTVKVVLSSERDDTYTGSPASDLVLAAKGGDNAKIQVLLAEGAQVNGKNERGNPALIEAARHGQTEAVEILLAAGADVDARAASGSTPLIEAAYAGHFRVLELLLDKKAEIDLQNRQGVSALAAAVDSFREDIVRTLLKKGADPNAKTRDGKSPLLMAVEMGRTTPIALVLLSSGANPKTRDADGRTGLMYINADIEILRHLVTAGAEVNASDKRGWTALMYAVDYGHKDKVRALIAAGADVNLRNSNGETALHLAKKYRANKEVIELLKKSGARD